MPPAVREAGQATQLHTHTGVGDTGDTGRSDGGGATDPDLPTTIRSDGTSARAAGAAVGARASITPENGGTATIRATDIARAISATGNV